jgi:hypothetical protein
MEPIYELVLTEMGLRWVYAAPALVGEDTIGPSGIIYAAGDVTAFEGTLNGRLTVAAGGSVDITGSVVYVDDLGRTSYLNGDDPSSDYVPNPDCEGDSVVGVLAEQDILYTRSVPEDFELNASLVAKNGRVGITGIRLDGEGEASLNAWNLGVFLKNSFRRLGGIISNHRPVSPAVAAPGRSPR